jgi:hypothetical protein
MRYFGVNIKYLPFYKKHLSLWISQEQEHSK